MATNQDKLTATVKLGDRDIEVVEPTEGQVFVLAQVSRVIDGDSQSAFRRLGFFGDVLENLFADADDYAWAYGQITTGALTLDEYLQLVPEIIKAFNIDLPDEEEAAPRRPAGRAQAVTKRPARRR